ncbi:MAG: ATP-binding cassette domain-containing protein [Vicinamibacterales bacterium]
MLGVNGAGKSTLVKTLAGELTPLTGERREGKGLKIGYFAQHQLDLLRPDESPLKHLLRMERNTREQQLRDYLGGFNFRGDMVDAPIERFSGGEKSRLILALLIWQRPNLLLLDEPTNHLDLDTREALTIALQDFEGAVVVVSHDRHLLRATAETLLIVTGGKLNAFDGDLDDYRNWLATRNRDAVSVPKAIAAAPQVDRKQQRRLEAEARNRASSQRRPLEQRLRKLEEEIAKLTAQKKELESRLADPNLYTDSNGAKLQAGLEEQSRVQRRLQEAEEQWLQLQSQLEALAVS